MRFRTRRSCLTFQLGRGRSIGRPIGRPVGSRRSGPRSMGRIRVWRGQIRWMALRILAKRCAREARKARKARRAHGESWVYGRVEVGRVWRWRNRERWRKWRRKHAGGQAGVLVLRNGIAGWCRRRRLSPALNGEDKPSHVHGDQKYSNRNTNSNACFGCSCQALGVYLTSFQHYSGPSILRASHYAKCA